MKKQIHEMKLNNAPWIAIKKNKKSIELRLNDEKRKKINVGDSIIFTNVETGKKLKRKVKRLHPYPNFQELYQNFSKKKLGYSKKEEANYQDMEKHYSKEDIKKYGVLGIELKQKRHILLKILLILFVCIGLYFLVNSVNKAIMKANDAKINTAISQLESQRVDYVFVEINPSFALRLEGNTVTNIACLNEDCMKIYGSIDIIGKNMNDGIDHLYNLAKENGFDTSKGATIKTTSNIKVDNLIYVTIEYIDKAQQEELLSKVKNNEEIKENKNDNYYTLLWEELKKDKDYNHTYTCNMDNNELKCYIKQKFIDKVEKVAIIEIPTIARDMSRTLDKFKINYTTEEVLSGITFMNGIYINGKYYSYVGTAGYVSNTFHDVLVYYDEDDEDFNQYSNDIVVPLTKFNLLTSQYDKKDIVWNGYEENEKYINNIESCHILTIDGNEKHVCNTSNQNEYYVCKKNKDGYGYLKEDCTSISKKVYDNADYFTENCREPENDFVIKREYNCKMNNGNYHRCNLNRNDFSLTDCITDDNIVLTPEEQQKQKEYMEKLQRRDDLLFNKGYSLNKKGTQEKCPSGLPEGACEYICLYPKDNEGIDISDAEPITCELFIFED